MSLLPSPRQLQTIMHNPYRYALLPALLLLGACASTPPALQLANPVPRCYPLPNRGSAPTTISIVPSASAPKAELWFTQSAGNRIGRMNPNGSGLVEYALPNANSSPRIIVRGSDGNIWFTQHTGNRIGRITREGVLTEFEIPTPNSQPRAIALGADGNLWFGMFAAGKIGRITPQGVISEFTVPTPNSGPRAIAAGSDGNLWFAEYRSNKIGRLTPQGVFTEFPLPRPNSGPGDITAGADGTMWFVELSGGMDGQTTDGNRIGRIQITGPNIGQITEYVMPPGSDSPINIAIGPDRNPWYTRGRSIGRVTADGRVEEFPLPEGSRAVGLTAGADREPPRQLSHQLWYADGARDQLCGLLFSRP